MLDRTHSALPTLAFHRVVTSPRPSDFAQQLDYEIVSFDAHDAAGVPIYHTNVMMCLQALTLPCCARTPSSARSAGLR